MEWRLGMTVTCHKEQASQKRSPGLWKVLGLLMSIGVSTLKVLNFSEFYRDVSEDADEEW